MKIIQVCKCLKSFESYASSKKKYCSKECYFNNSFGRVKTDSEKEKLRKSATGRVFSEERKRNIGKSRLVSLSEEDSLPVKELLDFGMPDGYILSKCKISKRVFFRYKKIWFPNGIPWQCKWLESDIEKATIEEIVKLSKLHVSYRRISELTSIYHKTVKLILNALNKRDPEIICHSRDATSGRKESEPERKIRTILESSNICFIQEHVLSSNSKFVYDFHISNSKLLIEVQGDYWHCNPKVFPKPINDYQKYAIVRDFRKKEYAKNLGFTVLPIWEYDISHNFSSVKEKILRNIEKCTLPTQ